MGVARIYVEVGRRHLPATYLPPSCLFSLSILIHLLDFGGQLPLLPPGYAPGPAVLKKAGKSNKHLEDMEAVVHSGYMHMIASDLLMNEWSSVLTLFELSWNCCLLSLLKWSC